MRPELTRGPEQVLDVGVPVLAGIQRRGDELRRGPPIVLVLGHEVSGVDPKILACCERVLRLPMLGLKGSLNVSVAFGIAVYALRFGGAAS